MKLNSNIKGKGGIAIILLCTIAATFSCKKEVIKDYIDNDNIIKFDCKKAELHTKATTNNDTDNNTSLKEVITLSESDSLWLIVEKELRRNENDFIVTKGNYSNSFTEKVGLLAYNYTDNTQFSNAIPNIAYNQPLTLIGGGTGKEITL